MLGTVYAAENFPEGGFDTVPEHSAATVFTGRRQTVSRAFEAIEDVGFVVHDHGESFVVIVPAGFTFWHGFEGGYGAESAACNPPLSAPSF